MKQQNTTQIGTADYFFENDLKSITDLIVELMDYIENDGITHVEFAPEEFGDGIYMRQYIVTEETDEEYRVRISVEMQDKANALAEKEREERILLANLKLKYDKI
jgi:hypothetical protein